MLQNRAVERASQNISRLLDVRPERTDVFREGNYINVSPKEVRTGERIEVKPGGRIPLDGILQENRSIVRHLRPDRRKHAPHTSERG